jgi:hypothetical protein
MHVVESIMVPEFMEGHRQERKWAHRVMWQRSRRFNITMVRGALIGPNGTVFVHPNTYKIIKEQLQ